MKKFKRLFIALLCAALLLPVGVSAAEVYDYYPVPEHRDIVINGCSEEQDWEESLLIKMDTDVAHGKNAIVRVMCDRSYLYLQFYVNDDDRAEYYGMPDGVSFELVEGARSEAFSELMTAESFRRNQTVLPMLRLMMIFIMFLNFALRLQSRGNPTERFR